MRTQHYLADILGNGSEEDMFRVIIEDLGMDYSASMPCDPTTGIPLQNWALTAVHATDADHAALDIHYRVQPLPNREKTDLTADFTTADFTTLYSALAARSIDPTFVQLCVTFNDVLRGINQAADPTWTTSKQDNKA